MAASKGERRGTAKNTANWDLPLSAEQEARAQRLHKDALIVDGTALAYTLESPYTERLLAAGVNAAMVTVFVGVERGRGDHGALALRAIDRTLRLISQPGSNLQLVLNVEDIETARAAGKFGIILAFQNATPLGDDASLVRTFWSMGVRCIQLTYNLRNLFADGCIEESPGGVSLAGREVLAAMQETGILVDLSHVADPSVDEAIVLARKPVAFTHCNARALCRSPRNKTDEQIVTLTRNGGVIGLNAFPAFVRDDGERPWLSDLLDHAEHLVRIAGSGSVGLGLDFIEAWGDEEKKNLRAHPQAFGTRYDFPVGLEGVPRCRTSPLGWWPGDSTMRRSTAFSARTTSSSSAHLAASQPLTKEDATMPELSIDGVKLHYDIAGAAVRHLVLVHAYPTNRTMWAPQIEALARVRTVVAYDVRGFGLSDAPDRPDAYSQERSIADLLALVDALGQTQIDLCGLSMGGNIALNFTLAHPARVSALVVSGTGAGSDDAATFARTTNAWADAAEQVGIDAFADVILANPIFTEYTDRGARERAHLRRLITSNTVAGVAHTARQVLAKRPTINSLAPRLQQLAVPALIVTGEKDVACTRPAEVMKAALPNSRVAVIPDTGHFNNLEQPESLNRLLLDFLARSQ